MTSGPVNLTATSRQLGETRCVMRKDLWYWNQAEFARTVPTIPVWTPFQNFGLTGTGLIQVISNLKSFLFHQAPHSGHPSEAMPWTREHRVRTLNWRSQDVPVSYWKGPLQFRGAWLKNRSWISRRSSSNRTGGTGGSKKRLISPCDFSVFSFNRYARIYAGLL